MAADDVRFERRGQTDAFLHSPIVLIKTEVRMDGPGAVGNTRQNIVEK